MSYTFTDDQVLSTLRAVVEENPNKVYEVPENMRHERSACFYVHKDEEGEASAGCIIGQVLHRLGVSLEDLESVETQGAAMAIDELGISGLSYHVVNFLRMVQRKQDVGQTWGKSVVESLEDYCEICDVEITLPEKA